MTGTKAITYHVVLTFTATDDGTIQDEPKEMRSAEAAKRTADALSSSKAGVIAFSRTGSPETGEFEDAVILARYGELPDELMEWLSAA